VVSNPTLTIIYTPATTSRLQRRYKQYVFLLFFFSSFSNSFCLSLSLCLQKTKINRGKTKKKSSLKKKKKRKVNGPKKKKKKNEERKKERKKKVPREVEGEKGLVQVVVEGKPKLFNPFGHGNPAVTNRRATPVIVGFS
jgi:flagellar biosynthesis component FlhA